MQKEAGSMLQQPIKRGCTHSSITWAAPLSCLSSNQEKKELKHVLYQELDSHRVVMGKSHRKSPCKCFSCFPSQNCFWCNEWNLHFIYYTSRYYQIACTCHYFTSQFAGSTKSLSCVVVTDTIFWKQRREFLLHVFALGKQQCTSVYSNTYFTKHV